MSAISALPDLRKEQKTKRCSKKDAPAEKHGTNKSVNKLKNMDDVKFYNLLYG